MMDRHLVPIHYFCILLYNIVVSVNTGIKVGIIQIIGMYINDEKYITISIEDIDICVPEGKVNLIFDRFR